MGQRMTQSKPQKPYNTKRFLSLSHPIHAHTEAPGPPFTRESLTRPNQQIHGSLHQFTINVEDHEKSTKPAMEPPQGPS